MTNCQACGMVTDPQLGNCVHCGRALPEKSSPLQQKKAQASDTCPNCGAMVRSSEVICITCNTNLVTGKVIPTQAIDPIAGITQNQKRTGYLVAFVILVLLAAATAWFLI